MQETPLEWCTEEQISICHIDRLALHCYQNFIKADMLYLSHDLYARLHSDFIRSQRYVSGNEMNQPLPIAAIMTTVGQLKVERVPMLCNFCHVGTESTFKRLEQIQIDKDFEKVFFGERS